MPRENEQEDDEDVASLQRRVADLESELKKCKKGMSAAAKKFKVQERELGDAERLCRERKRAVKSLTAQLEKAGTSESAGGGGGASDQKSARKIDSIISTGLVQFALSEMFSVVQDELRLQDADSFRRIESLSKFQSAALQVMKTSLKNLAGPLVDKLRSYAKENLSAGAGGLSDSESDSGGDVDNFGTSQPGPTSNPASASTSHTASPINGSRGTNAARLPYFPLVETQRGANAKHVRVTLSGQDYSRFPLTFTVTCITPLRGPAGASGSRRAKSSSSALDTLPPVSRTIADFEQLAEFVVLICFSCDERGHYLACKCVCRLSP